MKYIYLVRHAKSSWKDEFLTDFERPLNKRGNRDAPFIGKLMMKQGIKPDLLISSPANRALTTAKIFSQEIGYPFDNLLIEPKLYMAGSSEMLELLKEVGNNYNSVMIFSHNPGLTDFANLLSDKNIDNIPTCAVAAFNFNEDSWTQLGIKMCSLIFFEYPKKYFKQE